MGLGLDAPLDATYTSCRYVADNSAQISLPLDTVTPGASIPLFPGTCCTPAERRLR